MRMMRDILITSGAIAVTGLGASIFTGWNSIPRTIVRENMRHVHTLDLSLACAHDARTFEVDMGRANNTAPSWGLVLALGSYYEMRQTCTQTEVNRVIAALCITVEEWAILREDN